VKRIRQAASGKWVVLAARLLLGSVFLASAIGKLQHPALFVDTVVDYGLLPEALARLYGTVLPWAELAVGFSLILGLLPVLAAVVSAGLTVSFAVAGIYSLVNAGDVPAICGCFGSLVSLSHSQSLAVDAAMLLAAAVIILGWRSAAGLGVMWLARGAFRDRPAWTAAAFSVVIVGALTAALGLGITALNEGPVEGPVTERPQLIYFWNGCPDCYGPEVEQLKSLQAEYDGRVDLVEVDYAKDSSSLAQYGVADDELTVLLLSRDAGTAELREYARYAGHLTAGTFDIAAIRGSLEAMLGEPDKA